MKKDSIVQFICFSTELALNEFLPQWKSYSKKMIAKKSSPSLLQRAENAKNKFRYISRYEWPDQDFHFSFLTEKWSDHFPENNVRVVQAGGYQPLPPEERVPGREDHFKLVAFVSHDETDLGFYRALPLYSRLQINQAYYESCSYGYVLEFYVPEHDAPELLHLLKQRTGVDTGTYQECLLMNA